MATIISTKTSGVGGLEVTGDASGVLQLASNNGTTAVTVDASQNVGIGTSSPTNFGSNFKMFAVQGSDFGVIQALSANGSTTIEMMGASGVGFVGTRTNHPLALRTNDTERMRIDASGRVTMPFQPAFFARKTNGGAMSPVNPVLFNDVVTNIGSHYNASNGRFTAPVAGTYYFIGTGHCETTNNLARALTFSKNGAQVSYAYILNATGGRARIVNVSILTLAANDYITVATDTSDFWAGDSSGINFSGYLIG